MTKGEELYNALLAYMKNGMYDKAYECIESAYRLSKVNGYKLVRAYRQSMKKIIGTGEGDIEKNYELLHRTYVLTGRDIFDDFMIALEWYRPMEKRFWLPRRSKLLTIANAMQELADDKLDELFISQPPRTGKLLADDTPVLTTKGWKRHGDLRVGDYIFSDQGTAVKVTHVFPKGEANRLITFTDGTQIKCHENHEWVVYDRKAQRERTLETNYFEKHPVDNSGHCEPGKRGHRYHYQVIDREPIAGAHKDLPVAPYVLGAWLGDGRNTNPDICGAKEDHAIADSIVSLGYPIAWHSTHKTTGVEYYGFRGLRKDLQKVGMCHSRRRTEKHIPEEYLTAEKGSRLELLAGLIDTDGTLVRNERRYHFCTADEGLRDTFIDLIRTFGWRVCVKEYAPAISSSGVHARRAYWCIGFNPTEYIPCRLKRKQLHEFSKKRKIAVQSVEPIEPVPGNCISVEGGIYLAGREMIPTHNSTLAQFFLIWQMCRDPESTNLYSSYTKDVVDIFYNGILEILQDPDTYDLLTIFPKATVAATNAAIGFINIGRKSKYPSVMLRAINQALNGLADASGVILIDDIHSGIDEARNPELLLKTWSTIANNLLARRKNGTKHIWIGTRWSIYDAISKRIEMIETESAYRGWRYKVVNVPALNENDESNFDYPYGLGFSTDSYKRTRAMFEAADDIASWSAQYCGAPIERDGAIFEPSSLRYYNGTLPEEEPDRVLCVVDPSWGGGDYVAGVCCYQYGEDLFVHDVVFDNGDKLVTEPQVCDMAIRNNAAAMYIEGTRVTGTYADEVDNRLKGLSYRLSLTKTTKHWSSQSGKTQRIFDRAPEIRARMVFRDEQNRSKTYQKFMQNVFAFTYEGKNKHDDAPDVLAMTLVMVQGRSNKARMMQRRF